MISLSRITAIKILRSDLDEIISMTKEAKKKE